MRRPEFIYISKSVRSYQSMSHPPVSSSHINRQTQFFYCLCEFQLWFNSVSYALPKASKKPWQNVVCLKSMRNQLSIHLTELFNWKNLSQWGLRLRSHFTRFKKIIHMLRGPSAIVFFHEPRKTYALRIVDLDETLHANRNEKLNRVLQNKTLMLYYVHVCNCNGHEFRCWIEFHAEIWIGIELKWPKPWVLIFLWPYNQFKKWIFPMILLKS